MNSKPIADFSVESITHLEVAYTNESQFGDSYLWEFDDGTLSTEENPVHVFPSSGQYFVKLLVTNSFGSDSTDHIVVVKADPTTIGTNWIAATEEAEFEGRSDFSAVVFQDKMFVLGGSGRNPNNTRKWLNDVWSSTDGETWSLETENAVWGARRGHRTVVFNNKLWVIGGVGPFDEDTNEGGMVWSSANGKDWTLENESPGWIKANHSCVVFDDKIWVIGDGKDVWNSTDGISWGQVTEDAGWGNRYNHSSLVVDNQLWVIGGSVIDDDGVMFEEDMSDIWVSSDGVSWNQLSINDSFSARSGHSSLIFEERLFVIGGGETLGLGGSLNSIYSSTGGTEWTRLEFDVFLPPWEQKTLHQSVEFDGKMWIIGGLGGSSSNDVWYSE